MSKIHVPALYQTETFSSGFGHRPPHRETPQRSEHASSAKPQREADFLVQLMVSGDQDMRKVLGRKDVARARETAYAFAAAHKPSRLAETEQADLWIA